jgi:hypothetical protein
MGSEYPQGGESQGPTGGVGSAPEDNFSYFYGQQHGGQKRRVRHFVF